MGQDLQAHDWSKQNWHWLFKYEFEDKVSHYKRLRRSCYTRIEVLWQKTFALRWDGEN